MIVPLVFRCSSANGIAAVQTAIAMVDVKIVKCIPKRGGIGVSICEHYVDLSYSIGLDGNDLECIVGTN
jgi:hypothetical protein